MGLVDKLSDKIVKKATKTETIRLPYPQLVEVVKKKLLENANEETLNSVLKTAKGGHYFSKGKSFVTPDEKFEFHVGPTQSNYLFGRCKSTWILDKEADKFYQLDKDRHWKKFYKELETAIKMMKIR